MEIKILIMEDDKDINRLLTLHLENEGYKVISTSSGKEALKNFDDSIHLVMLDIMVPDIDGITVLSELRKTSTVPVLFLTAKTEEISKLKALGLGADDYITKPFSITEVIYRVKAHLRRNYNYNQNVLANKTLSFKDIVLDLDAAKVFKDGNELVFSNIEFKMLRCFLEKPDRIITKQQLYEYVWEEEYFNSENTIMVHLSRLREKLGDSASNPKYVRTVKGLGYRMENL